MLNTITNASAKTRVDSILKPLSGLVTKLQDEISKIESQNEALDRQRDAIIATQAENNAAKDRAESTLGKLTDLLA